MLYNALLMRYITCFFVMLLMFCKLIFCLMSASTALIRVLKGQ